MDPIAEEQHTQTSAEYLRKEVLDKIVAFQNDCTDKFFAVQKIAPSPGAVYDLNTAAIESHQKTLQYQAEVIRKVDDDDEWESTVFRGAAAATRHGALQVLLDVVVEVMRGSEKSIDRRVAAFKGNSKDYCVATKGEIIIPQARVMEKHVAVGATEIYELFGEAVYDVEQLKALHKDEKSGPKGGNAN